MDPLPFPSVSRKPHTGCHMICLLHINECRQKHQEIHMGKNYPIGKSARLTVGSISSRQQAKGISLKLRNVSISILKTVLYLCTLEIVLVSHSVPGKGCKVPSLVHALSLSLRERTTCIFYQFKKCFHRQQFNVQRMELKYRLSKLRDF